MKRSLPLSPGEPRPSWAPPVAVVPRPRPSEAAPAGSPGGPLLPIPASKLRFHSLRRELVDRPRLLDRLLDTEARLVLLSAQAGFGKSVLLAQWAAQDARRFACVSLEASDNDPVSFWAGVVMSVRQVEPTFGASVEPLLHSIGGLALDVLVRRLLVELETLAEPVVLVLDDFQLVRNRSCLESLELLIDRAPPQLQVVLATRYDRPLRVGRIRASGELLELRAHDLAFTVEETHRLMEETLVPPWHPDESLLLHDRTEGWPAGLQLASLSLRATGDRAEFLRCFGGSNRHVMDYLTEVVLASLSEDVRAFLTDTSMLSRLTAPLCDAVTGRSDSLAVLRELERLNLFVVPLDDGRTWYRYHHLFAEFLDQELATRGPAHREELHRRAYRWFVGSGDVSPAIEHALAADDLSEAADMVVSHWAVRVFQGRLATVAGWLDTFPAGYVAGSAPLSLVRAYVCGLQGRQDDARRAVQQSLGAPVVPGRRMPDGASRVEHSVALIRALLVWGDAGGQQEAARSLAVVQEEFAPEFRALSTFATGFGLFLSGDHEEALPHLRRAVVLGADAATWVSEMDAMGMEAQIALGRSQPEEARELAHRAVARAEENGLGDLPHAGYYVATLGAALARCGDLAEGDPLLARGIEQFGEWDLLLAAHLRLMRAPVRRRLGDLDGARALLDEARSLLARCGDTGFIGRLLPDVERSLTASHRRGETRTDLTDRELDVLRLMAQGLTKRDIAQELFLSFNTIHSHTKSIYVRLDVGSRKEAIARAQHLQLI
jgi:LuxR family transcriptional regulator, maltose regulon positive regulatory protein